MDEAQKLFDSKYTGLQIEEAITAGLELRNDPQLALANLGGRPNRNLADNCYFAGGGSQKGYGVFPINQRGKTSYFELQQTMFDRWWHTNDPGTFELTDEGLKITAEAGTNACMAQFFDVIVSEDTEVTLSALYRGQIILDYYGYTHTPSPVVNDGWGMHAYTYTIPAGTNLADKIYCPTVKAVAGTTAYILAVKFENGDKQTIAYKDSNGIWRLFERQDYQKTLIKCLSRMVQLKPNAGVGIVQDATTAYVVYPLTVPLDISRGNPVLTCDYSQRAWTSKGFTEITSAALNSNYNGDTALCLTLTGDFSGVTPGTAITTYLFSPLVTAAE